MTLNLYIGYCSCYYTYSLRDFQKIDLTNGGFYESD